MIRFLFNRLLVIVPTFLGITLVAFIFIHTLPGDPVEALAGERGVAPEVHARLMAQLGFDLPLWQQYLNYLVALAHGDLGYSFATKRPVLTEFFARFPATVELTVCAILLSVIVGVPAGILAAARRGTIVDQATTGVALVGYSMPIFWWGLLLIILFAGTLHWSPVSGRIDLKYFFRPVTGFMLIDSWLDGTPGAFRSALGHLILPTIVLATIPLAVIARQTRSAMLEVLGENYVRTAQGKGPQPCPRRRRPRAPQCAHSRRDHHRPAGRRAVDGRNPYGDDLLVAGNRQMDDRRHRQARLFRGPGRAAADCAHRHDGSISSSTCSTA